MLREPAFQQDRLDLYKAQALQGLERRNDNTAGIEGREFVAPDVRDVALLDDARHEGVGRGHHARRPGGLPQAVVPPGELHLRGVGRRRRGEDRGEARAAPGRLDQPGEVRGAARSQARRDARAWRVPGRQARREPGARVDGAPGRSARQSGRGRHRDDERHPRRLRLHLAHHEPRAVRRRAGVQRRARASVSASTTRACSAPGSSPRVRRSPRPRRSSSTRSSGSARRRSRPKNSTR